MSIRNQYSFWGSLSPLGGLTGAGLLVIASARLSWAIIVAGSLFWVYGLTTLSFAFLVSYLGNKFFPVQGRTYLFTCLASFFGSIYLLLFWLLCPLAALEMFIPLMLVPLFCAGSGIVQVISPGLETPQQKVPPASSSVDVFDHISNVVSQAASLSILIIAFSILREPLSFCSLSFPGSYHGMITIMYFARNSFFPISIFSQSAGALILLGYVTCLYQYGRGKILPASAEPDNSGDK